MKTLLLEKNDRVGGKAQVVTKMGFTYELWPVIATPMLDTKFHQVLAEVGMEHKLSEVVPAFAGGGLTFFDERCKNGALKEN